MNNGQVRWGCDGISVESKTCTGMLAGASMPELDDYNDTASNPKTVLISIEEVDSSGKVLKRRTLEAEQIDSENPPEYGKPIEDGIIFIE